MEMMVAEEETKVVNKKMVNSKYMTNVCNAFFLILTILQTSLSSSYAGKPPSPSPSPSPSSSSSPSLYYVKYEL